jgi:hypothetical protein
MKTEDDLLSTLNFFVQQCQKYGLNFQAGNFVLLGTMMTYCGRLITKDGVNFESKKLEALQTMRLQQSGADLVQHVAAFN